MNKQGPNKIDWTDYTWNPIQGKCLHECEYCYMNSMWKRFTKLAENKLNESILNQKFPKKHSKIFVGSSTDMWGNWVDKNWIHEVFRKIRHHKQHIYQFLTKNPERYFEFDFTEFKDFCYFGTTVDGTEKTKNNLHTLVCACDFEKKFVSFEPLLNDIKITQEFVENFFELDWIIIGADSRINAEVPYIWKAQKLIDLARLSDIPVFIKDNYGYPTKIKEFPGVE